MVETILRNLFWLINSFITAWALLMLLGLLFPRRNGRRQ